MRKYSKPLLIDLIKMFKLVILSTILLNSVAEAQLQLWEHYPDFHNGGQKRDIFESTVLNSFWNDQVSYVKAIKGDYVLYQDSDFKGERLVVLEGDDESMSPQWNDKLSSVRHVGSGCIKKDIDFQGNDIRNFPDVQTLDSCIDKCSNHQGSQECKSVTYNKLTRKCYLKHSKNGLHLNYKVGDESYNMGCEKKRRNNRIDECALKNYDFLHADLPTIHNVANIYDCVDHCEDNDSCVGITYNPKTKNCYPKNKRLGGSPGHKEGAYSVDLECLRSC